jgi:hypothetical protein
MHDQWSRAFAALPQETPPAQGWERMVARMDGGSPASIARKARSYRRAPAWIGLAAAAALAMIVLWPNRETPAGARPARDPQIAATHSSPGTKPAALPAPGPAQVRMPVEATRVAAAKPEAATHRGSHTRRAPAKTAADPLPELYSESAQLEALLAVARDDRVSSAGAALLSDELDAQVAAVDASLARPGLDGGERLRLWQARVDALRQAAGFESTQRLLASQGRSDVMLVSVD